MRASHVLAAAMLAIGSAQAQPNGGGVPVDLELLLAVDVSGSMDDEEHAVQRSGYLQALQHADLIDAIAAGAHGRIALAYMEWAGPNAQILVVPWRRIDGAESAAAFAAELDATPIAEIRGTSISGALAFGMTLFADNGFDGVRRVIDVSGDGANRGGAPVTAARDAVVAAGIVINGLPIMIRPSVSPVPLDRYYWDCVTGGTGSFVIPVTAPEELAAAIRRKLVLEVAGELPARVLPVQAAEPANCLSGEGGPPNWTR
jgi:hypothetical protein